MVFHFQKLRLSTTEPPYSSLKDDPPSGSDEPGEKNELLSPESEKYVPRNNHDSFSRKLHIIVLYTLIILLSAILAGVAVYEQQRVDDPSIGLWSPAQDAVSYHRVKFGQYFNPRSPYTQTPSKKLDAMWEDLYNFGLSGITPEEASKLYEPTAHLPHDNNTYVVTLGVFHQLHCVNHLRRALYPDEYPELWERNPNGTVKRDSIWALHWDHCIDILRQTLMCHADITPMPFFYRARDDNVYSVLASTQHCRDFGKIKEWAVSRQLTHWRWNETDATMSASKSEVKE